MSIVYTVDELFKEIVLYDAKVGEVTCRKIAGNKYELAFKASIEKYREDGYGKRTKIPTGKEIEIGIWYEDGNLEIENFHVGNGTIEGRRILTRKPIKVAIDPLLKTIDSFLKDNERVILYPN